MSLTAYVSLGKSGLRVSPFCLGTATFGEDWGWGASPGDSEAILRHYLENGGNFIDTANVYTKGHSEKIIGDYFAKDTGRRDRVVIATKFFSNLYPGDPNAGGAGRKAVLAQCEQSLRRLQTDYIDLYWLHGWDEFTPVEETLRALDNLVTSGKVRYIGFSNVPAWKTVQAQVIAQFRGWAPLVAIEIEYSLLQRTVEGELIPMALEFGLGVAPFSPLRRGALSGAYTRENASTKKVARGKGVTDYLNEHTYVIIDELLTIARELGTSVAAVALAWVQSRPGVSSTIIGAETIQQLESNLAALDVTLAPEHVSALNKLSQPQLDYPADARKRAFDIAHAGATVNGVTSKLTPLAPASDDERY